MAQKPKVGQRSENVGAQMALRLFPLQEEVRPLVAEMRGSQDGANGTNVGNTAVPGFKNEICSTPPRKADDAPGMPGA